MSMTSFDAYNSAIARIAPLDEAYYGKQKLKAAQQAMNKIYEKVHADPTYRVQDSAEANDFEQAIAKIFGLKRCSTYWRYYNLRGAYFIANTLAGTNTIGAMSDKSGDPYTIPTAVLFPDSSVKSPIRYGTNTEGFYDKDHTLVCMVCLNQDFISRDILTPEEYLAVILHEIGHNFDNSVYTLVSSWTRVIGDISRAFKIARQYDYDPAITAGILTRTATGIATEQILLKHAPEIRVILRNLDDILLNMVPIQKILKPIEGVVSEAYRLLNMLGMPMMLVRKLQTIPAKFLNRTVGEVALMLFNWRLIAKAETYADSFATQYGYGPELMSALEKISGGRSYQLDALRNTKVEPFLAPFYDVMSLTNEVFSTIDFEYGHGGLSDRYRTTLNTLDTDLKQSGLSAQDRKLILAERKRLVDTYADIQQMTADEHRYATTAFRHLANAWRENKTISELRDIKNDVLPKPFAN